MQYYALAAGGETVIVRMLELIEVEMLRSMALLTHAMSESRAFRRNFTVRFIIRKS